jgi:hypothetical protein
LDFKFEIKREETIFSPRNDKQFKIEVKQYSVLKKSQFELEAKKNTIIRAQKIIGIMVRIILNKTLKVF